MLPEQARTRKDRKVPPGGKPGKYPGTRTRGHEPARRGVSTVTWAMLDIDWMEMYPEMTLVNGPGNGYDLVHALMPLDIGPSLQEV